MCYRSYQLIFQSLESTRLHADVHATWASRTPRTCAQGYCKEYPWMVYSELLEGAFSMACAFFCKNHINKSQFVNHPSTAWHKRTGKCTEHELTQYHQESLQRGEIFTQAVEHATSIVSTLLDTKKAVNVERNRTILQCVLEAVICGMQCITLR